MGEVQASDRAQVETGHTLGNVPGKVAKIRASRKLFWVQRNLSPKPAGSQSVVAEGYLVIALLGLQTQLKRRHKPHKHSAVQKFQVVEYSQSHPMLPRSASLISWTKIPLTRRLTGIPAAQTKHLFYEDPVAPAATLNHYTHAQGCINCPAVLGILSSGTRKPGKAPAKARARCGLAPMRSSESRYRCWR